jgi:hypothetical protein
MLFDIVYGWRKWQGQRLKWFTLVLGLALFCALFSLTLNLFREINNESPSWVGNTKPLVTIAAIGISGQIKKQTRYNIDLLNKHPAVNNIASLSFQTKNITVNDIAFQKTSLAFYSTNLPVLLELPAPFSADSFVKNNVYISDAFWQYQLNGQDNIVGKTLLIKGQKLLVAGVMPANMNNVNQYKVDVWLPDSFLSLYVPEFIPDAKPFLNSKPDYFGFAELSKSVNTTDLQEYFREQIDTYPNHEAIFVKEHDVPWLIAGIELDPEAKKVLIVQCWTLIFLIASFGFIIFSTIFSIYSQQLIDRKAEFSLKIALGAKVSDLVKRCLAENFMMALTSVVFSIFFIFLLKSILQDGILYQRYFSSDFELNWFNWFVSLVISQLFFFSCTLLPLLKLNRNNSFSRSSLGSKTKLQTLFSQGNLVLQLCIATLAFVFTTNVFISEWQKQQIDFVNPAVISFNSNKIKDAQVYLSEQQKKGDWSNEKQVELAIAYNPFTNLDDSSLSYNLTADATNDGFNVSGTYVSSNYFSVLDIPIVVNGIFTKNTFAINIAFAEQLKSQGMIAAEQPLSALIGMPIQVNSFPSASYYPIAMITENAPHHGVGKGNPVVYLHYANIHPMIIYKVLPIFFSKEKSTQEALNVINNWVKHETVNVNPYQLQSTLKAQIFALNLGGRLLFVTSGFMALIILVLLALTLYYQVKANLMREKNKYGVMLALGINQPALFLRIFKKLLLSLTMALPMAWMVLQSLESVTQSYLSISLLLMSSFLACSFLVFLFVLLFGGGAIITLIRLPISTLLTQQE